MLPFKVVTKIFLGSVKLKNHDDSVKVFAGFL